MLLCCLCIKKQEYQERNMSVFDNTRLDRVLFSRLPLSLLFLLGFLFMYSLPAMAENISWQAAGEVKNNKSWTIRFSEAVNSSSLGEDTVYVTNDNGNRVDNVLPELEGEYVTVSPQGNFRYPAGSYTLNIDESISSASGKSLSNGVHMGFTVPGGNYYTFQDDSLPAAIAGLNYSTHLGGSGSLFRWSLISGAMPSGLSLNYSSGEISGLPRIPGEYCFTVRKGDSEEKELRLTVIENSIESVESFDAVSVNRGDSPVLPLSAQLTFQDNSTVELPVFWNSIDTSEIGSRTISGRLGGTAYTVSLDLLISEAYLLDADFSYEYYAPLNIRTVVFAVSEEVYGVILQADFNDGDSYKCCDYMRTESEADEGTDYFGLYTSSLEAGDAVTVILYDRYSQEMERRSLTVD